MYRLMAIAKYADRYVIPTAHVERADELEEIGCSLDFEEGPGDVRVRSVRRGAAAHPVAARDPRPAGAPDVRHPDVDDCRGGELARTGSTCSTGTAGRPTGSSPRPPGERDRGDGGAAMIGLRRFTDRKADRRRDDRVVHLVAARCLDYPRDELVASMPTFAEALSEEGPRGTRADAARRAPGLACAGGPAAGLRRHLRPATASTRSTSRTGPTATPAEGVRCRTVQGGIPALLGFSSTPTVSCPTTSPRRRVRGLRRPRGRCRTAAGRPSRQPPRIALQEKESPVRPAVVAVCPGPLLVDRAAVMMVGMSGPQPTESVGLDPYDPSTASAATHLSGGSEGVVVEHLPLGRAAYFCVVARCAICPALPLLRIEFGWTPPSLPSRAYSASALRFCICSSSSGTSGAVIPESWTIGASEGLYHFNALLFGGIAGVCTLALASSSSSTAVARPAGLHGDGRRTTS